MSMVVVVVDWWCCTVGVNTDTDDVSKMERHCDSLFMCIVTTLNEGLRNGGGIGDILRKPSSTVRALTARY